MMSELPPENPAPDPAPAPEPPGGSVPQQTVGRGARGRGAAMGLIALLVLLLAGVAAAPFWAPSVMPLLPWSRNRAADHEQALAARLAALEQQNVALISAQGALSRRLGDTAAALAGLKSGISGLGQRVDKIAAQMATQPAVDPAAVQKLQREVAGLGQRVDGIAARPAVDPAAVEKLQQEVAGLGRRAGDLAGRVAALETRMAAPARAEGKQAALLVALLQMRERLDAATPFAAPYAAFRALAQGRPELLAAAQPLAALAPEGVKSRAALARDLAHLAGPIATARAPAAADDWSGRVLDQLRRLVTIRRIGGGHETPPEAAVEQAQADLAHGDLAAAVKAIETLSGPSATAAQPWLAEARRRLAAEAALARLQQGLEAGITQQAAPASPAAAPDHAPPSPPGPGAH